MAQSVDEQRQYKERSFTHVWSEAKLPKPRRLAWEPASSPLRYRNRVRCRIDAAGRVGFFNPNKLPECSVLEPSVLEGIGIARTLASSEPSLFAGLSHLEVRARDSRGTGAIVLHQRALEPGSKSEPRRIDDFIVGSAGQPDTPSQRWAVSDDVTLEVPLDAFLQVNTRVNQKLVAHVREGLVARNLRSFADLYMGSGNFALPLLASGLRGVGVERQPLAVAAAGAAARAQGLAFDELCAEDGLEQAQRWFDAGLRVDAVVVDPPRAGLKQGVELIPRLTQQVLVYCSCNPRSLCRDLQLIVAEGFVVDEVRWFDMFPMTAELETVVWLSRPP